MASKTKLNSAQQVRIRTPNFIEECSNDMRTGRLHREPDNRCDTSRQRFSFETGNCSTYPGRQTSSGLLTSSERKSWRWSGLIPMFRNARLRLALAWVDEMPLTDRFRLRRSHTRSAFSSPPRPVGLGLCRSPCSQFIGRGQNQQCASHALTGLRTTYARAHTI